MAAELLRCVLLRKGRYVSEAQVTADPDDTGTLIAHLVAAVRRAGWGDHHLPDFELEVHESGTRVTRRVAAI